MPYTTITLKHQVAERLRASRNAGESYSELLTRLLDNQPAETVGEWLQSLEPVEGKALFTPEQRARLKQDQRAPRVSTARRRHYAAP